MLNMSLLTLHRKQFHKIGIPLWVFINEQPVGIMRGKEVNIQLPEGKYDLSIRILFQIYKWRFHIGGSKHIDIKDGEHQQMRITDKERWWNILFDIDLIFWIMRFFITLPTPWDLVYEVLSNGFFAIWLLRIWIIREQYFKLELWNTTENIHLHS